MANRLICLVGGLVSITVHFLVGTVAGMNYSSFSRGDVGHSREIGV